MELKVGMKAKCLSHTYDDNEFFTAGRLYEIVSVGECDDFEVTTNNGTTAYCLTSGCAHGEWEILEEE